VRTAFIKTLTELAALDDRIMLLTGDLGFGVVESFANQFRDRFINVGVAEQNMTGVAAGLALSGRIVFTYSIANFPTLRCLEQIRNDVCYHNANVKVVSVGGGFAYGSLGMSHHATEDLAVMRAIPNMTVVAPGDPLETAAAVRAVAAAEGPAYLRLGRADDPAVHQRPMTFELGKALTLQGGGDLTLISTGGMLPTASQAAQALAKEYVECRLISMHTLKPLDVEAVRAAARETAIVATLEEHSILGGLGGAVAEILAEMPDRRASLLRLGLPSAFVSCAGSREYLLAKHGLSLDGVLTSLRGALEQAVHN
jgi:transketolase